MGRSGFNKKLLKLKLQGYSTQRLFPKLNLAFANYTLFLKRSPFSKLYKFEITKDLHPSSARGFLGWRECLREDLYRMDTEIVSHDRYDYGDSMYYSPTPEK